MKHEYRNIQDLPAGIRQSLPEEAQSLYLDAFNHAWERAHASQDYQDEQSAREDADRRGWQAVTQEFRQREDGRWERDSLGDHVDPDALPDNR
mgnify:CR=1 FL=1